MMMIDYNNQSFNFYFKFKVIKLLYQLNLIINQYNIDSLPRTKSTHIISVYNVYNRLAFLNANRDPPLTSQELW